MQDVDARDAETGAGAEAGAEGPAPHVLAVHAAETVLAWFIGVFFSVAAVNFTLATTEQDVLGAALRVAGAVVVDACPLYLLLKGYSAAEYVARHEPGAAHRRLVARTALPQLVVAALCHCVLQLMTAPGAAWDWAAIALGPALGGALADVRPRNTPRGVPEFGWVVQAHTLYLLAAFELDAAARTHLAREWSVAPWALLALWLPGAAAAAAVPAEFATVAVRNPAANLPFFLAGFVAHALQAMPERKAALLAAVPRRALGALACVAAAVYVHHLDPYGPGPHAEPSACVSVFGGAPCLWRADAAPARFLPLHFAAVLWLVDADGALPPSLGGPLAEPLTVTLRHVNRAVAAARPYGTTWLLFGQFLATALHKLASLAAPELLARFVYLVVPAEAALVSLAAALARRVTAGPLADAHDALEARLLGPGPGPGASSSAVHI
jgi:hypothetical protein